MNRGFLSAILGIKLLGGLLGGFFLYKGVSNVLDMGLYNKKYVSKLIENNAKYKAERKLFEEKTKTKLEKKFEKKFEREYKKIARGNQTLVKELRKCKTKKEC